MTHEQLWAPELFWSGKRVMVAGKLSADGLFDVEEYGIRTRFCVYTEPPKTYRCGFDAEPDSPQ